jgi:hypothetical protein
MQIWLNDVDALGPWSDLSYMPSHSIGYLSNTTSRIHSICCYAAQGAKVGNYNNTGTYEMSLGQSKYGLLA